MTSTIPTGARVDLYSATLTVAGIPGAIPCQQKSGGSKDSEETRNRGGGGLPERSLGGKPTMENITVTVAMQEITHETYRRLRALVGAAAATVTETPLDANGVAFGADQLIGSGTLKRVGGRETDANGSDAATFEVEITTVSDSAGGL